MSARSRAPLRVALANDYAIVVAGLATMLVEHSDRLRVVELAAGRIPVEEVDVILYDTFGRAPDDWPLGELLATDARTVIFSWTRQSDVVAEALRSGAAGFVSKGATAIQIVEALESACAGRTVVRPETAHDVENGAWPGQESGLSARESEMLTFLVRGLSNQEIADRCYLSINSVKSYVRSAYRKIRATRRSQAIVWAMEHGFQPGSVPETGPAARVADPGRRPLPSPRRAW